MPCLLAATQTEISSKGESEREREKLQMIQVQSHISQRQHSFFPSATTIKSHPRLFAARKDSVIIFVRSNSRQENVTITPGLNKTKRQTLKKGKMITTQQPIASCFYFHNRSGGEEQRWENSTDICCAFVIRLALQNKFSTL